MSSSSRTLRPRVVPGASAGALRRRCAALRRAAPRGTLYLGALCLGALLSMAACGGKPQSLPEAHPVVEDNTVRYMAPAVERAHEAVRQAMGQLSDADDADALALLRDAEHALADLQWFYLPVTEARGDVLNAYREELVGRLPQRDRYLAAAREKLLQSVDRSGPQVEHLMQEILEGLTDVEVHSRAGQAVDAELEALGEKIQLTLLKAGLVLGENRYHEPRR